MKKQLEFNDGSSNKFWNVEVEGTTITINFGKIGTNGQAQTKIYPSAAAALKEAEKQASSKMKKGYALKYSEEADPNTITEETTAPAEKAEAAPVKKEKPVKPAKTESSHAKPASVDKIPVAIEAQMYGPGAYWSLTLPKDSTTIKILNRQEKCYIYNYKKLPTPSDAIIDAAQLIVDKLNDGFEFDKNNMEMPDGTSVNIEREVIEAIAAVKPRPSKLGVVINYDPGNIAHNSLYIKSIKNGDISKVKQLLERGASPSDKVQISKSKDAKPLETAVENKQKDIIALLLPLVEHPYISRGSGHDAWSILTEAASEFGDEAVEMLLECGYPLEKDPTILYHLHHLHLTDKIIDRIIAGSAPSLDEGYAILATLERDKADLAMKLLDRGVTTDISKVDVDRLEYYNSPLHMALEHCPDNLPLFKKLIEKGVDMSVGDRAHATAMDLAVCGKGSPEVRKLILENAPQWYKFNTPQEQKLHATVKTGVDYGWGDRTAYNEIISLLEAGTDPNCKDGRGCTPLHYAPAKQIPCFIKELIQYGADPNARDNDGRTPLFYYHQSYGGNGSIIRSFVESGADVNAIDNKGRTILIHATSTIKDDHDMRSVVSTFLHLKSDVTSADPDGNTFMHHAMINNTGIDAEDIISKAVEVGADLNAKNNDGYAPLHLAVMEPKERRPTFHDYKIKHLISCKANINIQDNDGNTAIHLTAYPYDDYDELVSGNPDLSVKNNAGKTALQCITESEYYEGRLKKDVDILLEESATGSTLVPMQWASQPVKEDAQPPVKLDIISAMMVTGNDADDDLIYLGDNRFCVMGNIPGAATIIDGENGKIIWHLDGCYDASGCAIADKDAVYVAREYCGSRYMTAHVPATGEEIWRCGLSSSYKQFGTILVQTNDYVVHANVSSLKIYAVSKKKGKNSRIPMAHGVGQYARRDLFTWKNMVFFFGIDEKADKYVIDRYDLDAKAYTGTITDLGDSKPMAHSACGDFLYLLANDGILYKIDLNTGEIVHTHDHCPEIEHEYGGSKYSLNPDKEGKLHYILSSDCGEHHALHTYDTTTDKIITSYDLSDMQSELSGWASTSDRYIYLFGHGGGTGREIEIYDAKEKNMIARAKLPNHGGYDWQEHALVVGDYVYVIQRGGNEYGDNSVLYRMG